MCENTGCSASCGYLSAQGVRTGVGSQMSVRLHSTHGLERLSARATTLNVLFPYPEGSQPRQQPGQEVRVAIGSQHANGGASRAVGDSEAKVRLERTAARDEGQTFFMTPLKACLWEVVSSRRA